MIATRIVEFHIPTDGSLILLRGWDKEVIGAIVDSLTVEDYEALAAKFADEARKLREIMGR